MLVPLIVEPDPDDPDCATLCVDGQAAGRPTRFVLDTGATRTQLTPAEPPAGAARSGVTNGVFEQSDTARAVIPELRVGDVTVSNLDVDVVTGPQSRSLLGLDFLAGRSLLLDVDRRMVGIDEPPRGAPHWHALGRSGQGHPVIDVRWPNATARAVWDTAAGMTIASDAFVHAHPELFTPVGVSVGTDATGHRQETPTYLVAPCEIGSVPFVSHRAAAVDLAGAGAGQVDLIAGFTTFSQAIWYVDFADDRWATWPRGH